MDRQRLHQAMSRARELARRGHAYGPNPRVGCVLLDGSGRTLGEGYHRGAGTAHAEVAALADAASRFRDVHGATAVVTLEPCNHQGRTGPCTRALLEAGIGALVYGVPDPNPAASGGAAHLAEAGLSVDGPFERAECEEVIRAWLFSVRHARPYMILKIAATLDGRTAAADGTSQWITGAQAREHAHRIRAAIDGILVGTGTVLADNPSLTARRADGSLADHQPTRMVLGRRDLPADSKILGGEATTVQFRSRDFGELIRWASEREMRTLLIEGGARLAGAAVRAGLVDEVHSYLAPAVLGAGLPAVADAGIETISEALRLRTASVTRLGEDVLIRAIRTKEDECSRD